MTSPPRTARAKAQYADSVRSSPALHGPPGPAAASSCSALAFVTPAPAPPSSSAERRAAPTTAC